MAVQESDMGAGSGPPAQFPERIQNFSAKAAAAHDPWAAEDRIGACTVLAAIVERQ